MSVDVIRQDQQANPAGVIIILILLGVLCVIGAAAGLLPIAFLLALLFSLAFVGFFIMDLKIFLLVFIAVRPILESFLDPTRMSFGGSSIQLVGFLGIMILFGGFIYAFINKVKIREMSVVGPMLIFCICSFPPMLLLSLDKMVGFKDWVGTASSFMLFVLVASIFSNKKDIRLLLHAVVLSTIPPLVVGFYQLAFGRGNLYTEGFNRVYATFIHPNSYAFFLVIMLLICIPLMMESKKMAYRLAYGALCTGMAYQLIMTGARSSWFGFLAGLLVLAILRYRIFFLVVPVILLPVILFVPTILERFQTSQSSGALTFRFGLWSYLLPNFWASPIVGSGLGSFATYVEEGTGNFYLPHNDYLRILIDTGLIGLASYLAIMINVGRASLRAYRSLASDQLKCLCLSMAAVAVAFLVTSFSENLFRTVVTQTYIWVLAGMVAGAVRAEFPSINRKGAGD